MESTSSSNSLILVKWGIIGALLSFSFAVIVKFSSLAEDFSETLGWVSFLGDLAIYSTIIFLTLNNIRSNQSSFITYGSGLGNSTLMGAVMGLFDGAFNFVYMNYIDNGLIKRQIDLVRDRLEDQGWTERQIADYEKVASFSQIPGVQFIGSVFISITVTFFLGLVISGIMKREKPMFD